MVKKKSVIEEYFEYYEKYKKEYDKVVILMAIGSFMEMYETPTQGNLSEIVQILNIQKTKKNKNIEEISISNPTMAGVPVYTLNKYIKILIEHGYNVVVIDQHLHNGNITRKLRGVYSKSINEIDFENEQGNTESARSLLISIFVEDNVLSIITLDNTINKITIIEKEYQSNRQDIPSLFYNNPKSEFIVYGDIDKMDMDLNIHWIKQENTLNYRKIGHQNDLLKEFFKDYNMGLLTPIEFLNLEKLSLSTMNLISLLFFIKNHDTLFLQNIKIPEIIDSIDYLSIELDTLEQLNVFPTKQGRNSNNKYDSLYNVINFTSTILGRRKLKEILQKPYKNNDKIEQRYLMSNDLINKTKKGDICLKGISDIDKLHRKCGLEIILPQEFVQLHQSYLKIYEVIEKCDLYNLNLADISLTPNEKVKFKEYIDDYTSEFDLDLMTMPESDINFIKRDKSLIKMGIGIKQLEEKLEVICNGFDNLSSGVSVRLLSDSSHYYLVTTKIRFEVLRKHTDIRKLNIKYNKNEVRFSTDEFDDTSEKLFDQRNAIKTKLKLVFLAKIKEWYSNYKHIFAKLSEFVSNLDILLCNVYLYNDFKYTCPIIDTLNAERGGNSVSALTRGELSGQGNNGDSSYIEVKNIRHPIIEKVLQDTSYITNDLLLNDTNNIVLFGFNSSGKSSLLRSIGINVILAQCGFFVAASYFKYIPFHKLICQVDLTDNFYKNSSSFITELKGIKHIMQSSNENSLVLVDEMINGTESVSATTIFASVINELSKNRVKFLCTTHLHDLAKLNIIKKNDNIKVCHLDVEITDNRVIFKRKLKNGTINELYGIEIASTILDRRFVDTMFKLREELIKGRGDLFVKKSKYNTKKVLVKCEICNYTPKTKKDFPLETHHINFQKDADTNGFFKDLHFHKNEKYNLVSLCKDCHLKVTLSEIVIRGYLQTSDGVILDYTL
jgi:DNA mismatch repair protein MutS